MSSHLVSAAIPPPHIITPTGHTEDLTNVILLHGTSINGAIFSNQLQNLFSYLPGTTLIFPSGSPRYVTVLGREVNAWFDIASFADRRWKQELGLDGLRQSVVYLAALVADVLTKEQANTVVLGYSSGAAMLGILLLSGEVDRIVSSDHPRSSTANMRARVRGWIGISGYLPYEHEIRSAISHLDSADLSARRRTARRYVRELLDLDPWNGGEEENEIWEETKIWLGHGEVDVKVKTQLGEEWRDLLGIELGLDVQWRGYEGLGHDLKGVEGMAEIVCHGMEGLGLEYLVDRNKDGSELPTSNKPAMM